MAGNRHAEEVDACQYENEEECELCGEPLVTTEQLLASLLMGVDTARIGLNFALISAGMEQALPNENLIEGGNLIMGWTT